MVSTHSVLRESARTAIRRCIEPVRRNVLPLCRRVIRHKARVNARKSLHKGCGALDGDGTRGRIGMTGRGKARGNVSFRSLAHAAYIVNLEAADIELDDDYRVARYS